MIANEITIPKRPNDTELWFYYTSYEAFLYKIATQRQK